MTKVAQAKRPHVIAALDIGSTKVSVVIGIVNPPVAGFAAVASPISSSQSNSNQDYTLDIVGLGTAINTGLRQGVVVNVEATIESIKKAREEAELMSGYTNQRSLRRGWRYSCEVI